MKFLLRLQHFGFDVRSLQSTDFRLWSDRRSILLFLLAKLCGGEEIMLELLETASKEFQLDDETTRLAKALFRLFSVFQLDHLSLDSLLGVNTECNLFLESTLDLIEFTGDSPEMEMSTAKHKSEMTGFEGFMSNYALLESTLSKLKDLEKQGIDIFPMNLKMEASIFKTNVEESLEQCFVEVLSRMEEIKKTFSLIHISLDDAKPLLEKYTDEKDHGHHLQGFTINLTIFMEQCIRFIEDFLNCFRVRGEAMKGIGYQSKAIIDQYRQVIQMTELLNKTTMTLNKLTGTHQDEGTNEIQGLFGDQETQVSTAKIGRRNQ